MSRAALPDLVVAVLAAVPLAILAVVLADHRTGVLQAGLLVLAALGLHAGLRALQAAFPKAGPPPGPRHPAGHSAPASWSTWSAGYALPPPTPPTRTCCDASCAKSPPSASPAATASTYLDSQHDEARAVLGAELWALVGPDLDRPPERDAAGIDIAALRAAIQRLERT